MKCLTSIHFLLKTRSPSSRGRGLKYLPQPFIACYTWSPSSRGRGLKSSTATSTMPSSMSPSSRGRGLKYQSDDNTIFCRKSPSSRGRGLKCPIIGFGCYRRKVALFTRAWIEIAAERRLIFAAARVALFTRAWIEISCCRRHATRTARSPSLRGRGLKYDSSLYFIQHVYVALFTRAWIEIDSSAWTYPGLRSRPLYEGVD